MPDSVEVANGTNPGAPDSNGDVNGNGYTNIEDWFNSLAPSPSGRAPATALTLKGDKGAPTVTANGAAPTGTVTFSVGGESKTKGMGMSGQGDGQAQAWCYIVSARVGNQPAKPADRVDRGTASYTVPRIATKSRAFASDVGPRLAESARPREAPWRVRRVGQGEDHPEAQDRQPVKKATVRLCNLGVAKKMFAD